MNYDILTKRNYEGLSTEYIHRFLNKSVIIALEERGIDNIFVPGGIVAGYACYSVPINGTNILRRFLVIGRELNLSLFININAVPKLVQNNANTALGYLKLTDFPRNFSSSILIILIEDRRIVHAERINNSRNLVVLQASDIVIFRTAIQSNLSKNKGAKLSYSIRVRGPYQIIRDKEFISYFVRNLNKSDSPELKLMAYDLHPLSPSLNPYGPVDSIYTHYLNQIHALLVNNFKGHSILNCII